MTIILKPGDELTIKLEGTDGEFRVGWDEECEKLWDTDEVKTTSIVYVDAALPDFKGRDGLIYRRVDVTVTADEETPQ